MSRASSPTTPMAEQRGSPRVEAAPSAIVTAGRRRVAFRVDDLSTGGARLSGALTLVLGQRITISLMFDDLVVEADAEVVRVQTTDLVTDQVAVRFLAVPLPFYEAIDRYVSTLLDDDQRTTDSIPRISPSIAPS